MFGLNLDAPAPECECIPSLKAIPWNERPHRIPIDCWTEEDEYRSKNTYFIVAWRGDEDCMARNDGPIAIYRSYAEAMARAQKEAMDENGHGRIYPADNGFRPDPGYRGAVEVVRLMIEKEEEDD